MATIFNEQRVLGVRIVSDGTVLHNSQPVIGVVEIGRNTPFVGNERTLGINVLGADAPIYNDQPVIGVVPISDGRALYNNQKVLPVSGAIADYDFRLGSYYGPPLTCVRASSAYVEDLAGNWTLVPANTLRRSNKGVLVEESRTNSALYSQQFDNATWTKVATATVTANSGVGRDGTVSADTLNLPAAGDCIFQAISLPGGSVVTWSIFLAGSGTINLTINSSGGTFKTATKQVTLTSTLTRYDLTLTMNANNTGITVNVGRYDGVGPAGTATSVLAWQGQVEVGAFPSSIILTTGTAATRAADVITAPLSFGPAFTMIGIGRAPALSNVVNRVFARGTQGGVNKYRVFLDTSNDLVAGEGANNVSRASGLARGQRACFAASGDVSGQSLSIDGGALATGPGLVSSHDVLNIGDGAGAPWNAFVERVIVLPYRATPADLPRLSSLLTWGG